ncbi:MAG: universal stress protein [Salinarimonas sp.]
MDRLLVATDGSEHAARAVSLAGTLAARFDAEIVLVHVVPHAALSAGERELIETEYAHELAERLRREEPRLDPHSVPASFLDSDAGAAGTIRGLLGERILEDGEEAARTAGATRVRRMLAHGDPAHTILAIAEREGADTIVLGSRGLGELRALIVGSVSHKVGQLAHTTVITVR